MKNKETSVKTENTKNCGGKTKNTKDCDNKNTKSKKKTEETDCK